MTDARRHLSPWARQPDPRIAALAEALPDAANAAIANRADGYWERYAVAILAALDDWTLVPSGVAEFVCTAEYLDGLRATIARLREAVETEWYNGNMAEDARIRILADPAAPAALAQPEDDHE